MSFLKSGRFFSVVLFVFVSVSFGAEKRPNVVIIYTDDQGSVDANCYGSSDLVTPNMDRLAAEGVRFTQMLAPSAICSSSRAGLMTGLIPPRAGVAGNVSSEQGHEGMPSEKVTMAEMFKAAGYKTGHIGKWHLGYTPETMPNAQGFDFSFGHMGGCIDNYSHFFYWQGPNRHDLWLNGKMIWRDGQYFGDLMQEAVEKFVSENQEGPFFVYWAINWPHYPLQATEKWREAYEGVPSPRDKYGASVSTTDELIGKFIGYLEEQGLRENTIVVVQSDHGHSVEERTFFGGGSAGPYRGHKGTLFEGGLRVPSIVSWPGSLPEGEIRAQFVMGTDWFPTLAELAGVSVPNGLELDGKSIVSVIKDESAPSPHENGYWRLGANPDKAKWAVRKGRWKLLGNTSESVRPEGVPELTKEDHQLFLADLFVDVGETQNVAKKNPKVVEELLKIREGYEKSMAE